MHRWTNLSPHGITLAKTICSVKLQIRLDLNNYCIPNIKITRAVNLMKNEQYIYENLSLQIGIILELSFYF